MFLYDKCDIIHLSNEENVSLHMIKCLLLMLNSRITYDKINFVIYSLLLHVEMGTSSLAPNIQFNKRSMGKCIYSLIINITKKVVV